MKFKGTGVFMDEEDLDKKYASKPLQLAAIKNNTRTMWDAVREVKLYEDVAYERESFDEDTRTE